MIIQLKAILHTKRRSLKVNQHETMVYISNVEFCLLLNLVLHGLKFSFKILFDSANIAEVATSFFPAR
jgi:hypothetical protein